MNFYLENFLYFIGGFIFILLLQLWVYKRNKKKNKEENIGINLIIKKHNLDLKKTSYGLIYIIVSIMNSFIISFTSVIIININNFFYKLLVGFVLIMVLIYSLYEIAGRILYKRESNIKVIKEKVKKEVKTKSRKKAKKNV